MFDETLIITSFRLAGAVYLLCTHPKALARLREEVDGSFDKEEQITLLSAQYLKYLIAVLNETLRIYPAAVGSVPRIIQRHGETVGGFFLPGGVCPSSSRFRFPHTSMRRMLTMTCIEQRRQWISGTGRCIIIPNISPSLKLLLRNVGLGILALPVTIKLLLSPSRLGNAAV